MQAVQVHELAAAVVLGYNYCPRRVVAHGTGCEIGEDAQVPPQFQEEEPRPLMSRVSVVVEAHCVFGRAVPAVVPRDPRGQQLLSTIEAD